MHKPLRAASCLREAVHLMKLVWNTENNATLAFLALSKKGMRLAGLCSCIMLRIKLQRDNCQFAF
jgi:hypothetical protein